MYRFGANIGLFALAYVLTMLVTSEIFLPVFYRLATTSTYEVSVLLFCVKSDVCAVLFCNRLFLFPESIESHEGHEMTQKH